MKTEVQKQPKLYIMVGLSASGKSTIAKKLAKENDCVIVSSDSIRGEICEGGVIDQTNNGEVFKIFYKRIREYLKAGRNVIADATNLTVKARRSLLGSVAGISCNRIAYIIPKPVEQCIEDNIYKEYPVPHHLIQKQMMNFQIPFMEEGLDEIVLHRFENAYVNDVFISDCFEKMDGFEQKNPYHTMDLGRHCKFTYEKFIGMEKYTDTEYAFAAKIHDVGKLFTQKFDDNGVGHYYQHENVGCYYLLSNLESVRRYGDYSDEQLLNILFLVNYHMLPMGWGHEKRSERWERIFGKEKYRLILDFHVCDKAR